MSLTAPAGRQQALSASVLAIGMAGVVGSALLFEHVGGYIPCKLCLEQRLPYYIGAPVMLAAVLASTLRLPGIVTRGLILVGALLMTWGLWMGVYHSGVEWGWWAGPTDCGVVAGAPAGGSLLDSLNTVIPPSCDEAALRILGLSLAGWNAIASLVLAAIAYRGAFARA
ncbi:MAG: disulfide bond formation protein B [Mesorhizobium sp.]